MEWIFFGLDPKRLKPFDYKKEKKMHLRPKFVRFIFDISGLIYEWNCLKIPFFCR